MEIRFHEKRMKIRNLGFQTEFPILPGLIRWAWQSPDCPTKLVDGLINYLLRQRLEREDFLENTCGKKSSATTGN